MLRFLHRRQGPFIFRPLINGDLNDRIENIWINNIEQNRYLRLSVCALCSSKLCNGFLYGFHYILDNFFRKVSIYGAGH